MGKKRNAELRVNWQSRLFGGILGRGPSNPIRRSNDDREIRFINFFPSLEELLAYGTRWEIRFRAT